MTIQNEAGAVPQSDESRTAELEARIAELERRLEAQEASGAGAGALGLGEAGASALAGAGDMAASTARAAGRGAQEAVSSLSRNMIPDDARQHLRAAAREQLMVARIFLDRWIERLERDDEERAPRRHEEIEIEE